MENMAEYSKSNKLGDRPAQRDLLHTKPAEINSQIPQRRGGFPSSPERSHCSKEQKGRIHNAHPLMERRVRGDKAQHGHAHCAEEEEDNYQTVNDPEDICPIRICPAKPFGMDVDYIDRAYPRLCSPKLTPSPADRSPENRPILPKRNIPGPSVERDLKPSRHPNPQNDKKKTDNCRTKNVLLPTRPPKSISKDHRSQSLEPQNPSQWKTTPAERMVRSLPGVAPRAMTSNHSKGTRHNSPHRPPGFSQDLEFQHPVESSSSGFFSQTGADTHKARYQPHGGPRAVDDINMHKQTARSRPVQASETQSWYVGPCDRVNAENALRMTDQDGAFLVRDCSKTTTDEPFVLAVFHDKKVYNIKIRFMKSICKFALGTGLRTNDMFDSVDDIIKFHMIFPIVLVNGKDQSVCRRKCILTYPLTKDTVVKCQAWSL